MIAGRGRDAALLAAVVALPLAVVLAGSRGGHPITLNFGPGDAPYIAGFAPEYEIDDKVGTHWTTYHAAVALPLEALLQHRVQLPHPFPLVLLQAGEDLRRNRLVLVQVTLADLLDGELFDAAHD